jgi:putative two-component system response regulator
MRCRLTQNMKSSNPIRATLPKMKLLVVDDEPANATLLEEILGEAGYTRVQSITDSRQAVKVCKEFEPDLVLLDLMMPHVDGFSVLEGLRHNAFDAHVPVIVLTADITEEAKLRALSLGATDFLLKPFDHVEVLLRIDNLLELRRLQLQLENQRDAFEDAVRARAEELRHVQAQLASL